MFDARVQSLFEKLGANTTDLAVIAEGSPLSLSDYRGLAGRRTPLDGEELVFCFSPDLPTDVPASLRLYIERERNDRVSAEIAFPVTLWKRPEPESPYQKRLAIGYDPRLPTPVCRIKLTPPRATERTPDFVSRDAALRYAASFATRWLPGWDLAT